MPPLNLAMENGKEYVATNKMYDLYYFYTSTEWVPIFLTYWFEWWMAVGIRATCS